MTIASHSPEHTRRLGEALGKRLRPGDVVLLSGGLGAGKSEMARGIARGLDVEGPLPSPSFPILLVHEGAQYPLYHMDLYRLEGPDELYAAGLDEVLGGDGVAVVEWPQRAGEAMPRRHLRIDIDFGAESEERCLAFTLSGDMPETILAGLEELS